MQSVFGDVLFNADCKNPQEIKRSDVANVLKAMPKGTKTISDVVEWVNVVRFTGLFMFTDNETDSIISVPEILETPDEDGVTITAEELKKDIGLGSKYRLFGLSTKDAIQ